MSRQCVSDQRTRVRSEPITQNNRFPVQIMRFHRSRCVSRLASGIFVVRFHDAVFCNKTPQSVKLREQHTKNMCYYTTKNQYTAIKSAKNMIADNLYEFTALDIEYVGKSGVWFTAAPVIDKRNNSIVDKIALLSVLASGSLTNGYWHMPKTEDACRKYKKIRKAWNAGKRPEFYDEYDDNWDEHYEVVSI